MIASDDKSIFDNDVQNLYLSELAYLKSIFMFI